ncbi:PAS domain S-box protein [Balneolaceae bacterium YR4-1]|uniref:Sensor protein FixL n=1 Tax=Halalkalibaculum roseum TaxID=2709311 RepID=A0A6M1SUJ0_9BACT|nr:PAS domain S-box protein [Halalkalibaculum roseum]NGP76580.1 PAS domain S-box protein [Halalkalibaculum roseum]
MGDKQRAGSSILHSQSFSAEDVLNNIYHAIIVTDLEGTIIYWNEGGERLFGYKSDEIIGKKASILYPKRRKNNFVDDLENLNEGGTMTGQWLGRHKNGAWVWLDIKTRLLKNQEGDPIGIVGSACDIAKQKKAESRLQESKALANAILETTVEGVITINPRGIILSFNKSAEEMFGYKEEELLGRNIKMLMPSPHKDRHDQYLKNYLSTGKKKIIGTDREVRGRRKDGSTFPMELSVSEVNWDNHKIFTGLIKDLTEKRELEREIIQISEEEKRRIGQDLHDGLGQMLTGIGLMSQNLAQKMEANGIPGSSELKEITEMIKEADNYARTLSHSLTPVEVESGSLTVSLEQLCRRARKLFDIKCKFEGNGDVKVDNQTAAIHLYRIAQEAISNAVKHGKADNIHVSLENLDDKIRMVVEDDGIGFEKAAEKGSKDGLGVHTMRYRAHMSGGDLQIGESSDGKTQIECLIPESDILIKTNKSDILL